MYKQTKLQGHASYTSLETQERYTYGHLAVTRYVNIGQSAKITPIAQQTRNLFLPLTGFSSIAN